MKQIFFIIVIAFGINLNAQTEIDKLPPLPSAAELAKGEGYSYLDKIYSERNKNSRAAYDEAEKEYQKLVEEFKHVPVTKGTMEEAMGMITGNSQTRGNPYENMEIPNTANMSDEELNEYLMKMSATATQQMESFYSGIDTEALARMSEQEQAEYIMKQYSQQMGIQNPFEGMDMGALANMSEAEQEKYMQQMAGSMFGGFNMNDGEMDETAMMEDFAKSMGLDKMLAEMGIDVATFMNMSDAEQEELLTKNAAGQMGMSLEEFKRMETMSDSELMALWEEINEKGTPAMQQYNKAKELFENQCKAEREKTKEQMHKVYDQKYRAKLKTAENEMANCEDEQMPYCFWQAYARWNKAQEDYKLECYDIWRSQIVKEQEAYKQMYKKNDPKNEGVIFSDYMTITLQAFDLPEMEWMFNEL